MKELQDSMNDDKLHPIIEKHFRKQVDKFIAQYGVAPEFRDEAGIWITIQSVNDAYKLYHNDILDDWLEEHFNTLFSPYTISNYPEENMLSCINPLEKTKLSKYLLENYFNDYMIEYFQPAIDYYQNNHQIDIKPILMMSEVVSILAVVFYLQNENKEDIDKEMVQEYALIIADLYVFQEKWPEDHKAIEEIKKDLTNCYLNQTLKTLLTQNKPYLKAMIDNSGFQGIGTYSFEIDNGDKVEFNIRKELLNYMQDPNGENLPFSFQEVKEKKEQMIEKIKKAHGVQKTEQSAPIQITQESEIDKYYIDDEGNFAGYISEVINDESVSARVFGYLCYFNGDRIDSARVNNVIAKYNRTKHLKVSDCITYHNHGRDNPDYCIEDFKSKKKMRAHLKLINKAIELVYNDKGKEKGIKVRKNIEQVIYEGVE